MGDSRSWAADMEDEVRKCRHGVAKQYLSRYCSTDNCECRQEDEYLERATYSCPSRSRMGELLAQTLPPEEWKDAEFGIRTKSGWVRFRR